MGKKETTNPKEVRNQNYETKKMNTSDNFKKKKDKNLPWWVELLFVQIGLPDKLLIKILKAKKTSKEFIKNEKKSIIIFLFVITTLAYFYPVIKHAKNKLDCEAIAKNYIIKNKNIILYGESLGTGVATELGQDNSFAGIVLESPFTSIADAAKIYYPYLPIDLLIKDRYDSLKKIKNINIPILIMHGKKDDVVPFKMGVELFEKANNPKFSYFSDNDDHMMEFNDQLMNALRKFLGFNT